MRKLLPTLAILALLVAACGGGEDDPAAPGNGAAPPPDGPIPTATPLAGVPEPIVVTGGTPTPAGDNGQAEVIYVVESGDALSIIAARFGVTVEVIQRLNDLDGFDIFVGQELRIPRTSDAGEAPAPQATPTPTPAPPGDPNVYVVQEGDTALGIAFQFDVTLEALEQANGGPGSLDMLQIGQEVRIPPRN